MTEANEQTEQTSTEETQQTQDKEGADEREALIKQITDTVVEKVEAKQDTTATEYHDESDDDDETSEDDESAKREKELKRKERALRSKEAYLDIAEKHPELIANPKIKAKLKDMADKGRNPNDMKEMAKLLSDATKGNTVDRAAIEAEVRATVEKDFQIAFGERHDGATDTVTKVDKIKGAKDLDELMQATKEAGIGG